MLQYKALCLCTCDDFVGQFQVWKLWVENKTAQGRDRMNQMVKCLLLRRTKDQKSLLTGKDLVELPTKTVQEHQIDLSEESDN